MKILVTGCAGFIGSNLCDKLLKDAGNTVVGIDNFNDYYDPKIKENNLINALSQKNFKIYRLDILDFGKLKNIFKKEKIDVVIHLAARAGVRPSIKDPLLYARVNILGTANLLRLSVEFKIKKFIFGSSSSVYGNSKNIPFTEDDPCQNIISPYAASKRAAEFWVESFYRTYSLKSVILRFFTVYGPRGRIDMAPAIFTQSILSGKTINMFGDGKSSRDYTFIDDIVSGIQKAILKDFDFEIFNLGNSNPIGIANFIELIEKVTGKIAIVKKVEKQVGDVEQTWANIEKARSLILWKVAVNIREGLGHYIKWLENTLINE